MKIEHKTINMLVLTDAAGLEPIRVMVDNFAPGAGRIIIHCWDQAWTAAWYKLGADSVEHHFVEMPQNYLVDRLTGNLQAFSFQHAKREKDYLRRVVEAVQIGFRAELVAQPA